MDMPVSYSFNATAEEAAALAYTSLRYFYITPNSTAAPLREFTSVTPWTAPTASDPAASFSGVCWFTARDVANGLRDAGEGDVPIGMLHSALGGTAIQQWTSPEAAKLCPKPTTGPNYSYGGLVRRANSARPRCSRHPRPSLAKPAPPTTPFPPFSLTR